MAEPLITHFDPEPSLLRPLLHTTEYSPWNAEIDWSPDWPDNILSKRTVIYGDGTIARQGDAVTFATNPVELALCRRLAAEAGKVADKLDVPRCSGGHYFGPFYNVAQDGAAAPGRIDAELIRTRFAKTIFPLAEVVVEPMAEAGEFWASIERCCSGHPSLQRWRSVIQWFRGQAEFITAASILIGDNLENDGIPESDLPIDVEAVGVVMPRLIVGLTRKGSLAGLSGCAVLS